jgi:hypothetical protein
MALNWKPIDTAPEGVLVMTKIDDADGCRNEQPMMKHRNLWWIDFGAPREMYVYYKPTHWAELCR